MATTSENYILGGVVGEAVYYPALSLLSGQYGTQPLTLVKMGTSVPSVITLDDGSMTSDGKLTVSGTIDLTSPPGSLTVNGVAVNWDLAGHFTTVLQLTPGSNLIQVTALDQNQIASGISRTVYYNSLAPKVKFVSPANNDTLVITQAFTVSGTVDSDAALTLRLNGVDRALSKAGGNFSATLSGIYSGDNSVVATATRGGLSSSTVIRLIGVATLHSGDVNNDGVVGLADAQLVYLYAIGLKPPSMDDAAIVRCDVAGPGVDGVAIPIPDGKCDMSDFNWLMMHITASK